MGVLDFLSNTAGGIGNQIGGVLGQVAQMNPQQSFAPQSQSVQQKPKFWQTPEFASTLTRLGANLAAASSQNSDFMTGLSLATAQTVKDNEAAREQAMKNQLLQAQIMKTQAESMPSGPFSGTGFENQVAKSYYDAYIAQGMTPLDAQVKASQAVFNREPTFVQMGETLVPVPGRTLPPIGSVQTTNTPVTAQGAQPFQYQQVQKQPDNIDKTAQSLGFVTDAAPQGGLLPPPSGVGAPDMSMFKQSASGGAQITVPQMGGPKTQQALTQHAGEKKIDLDAESLQKAQDKTISLGDDINAGYSALQSMNQMLSASSEAFSSQGIPQGIKTAIARTFAPNDPSIQRQLAATAQLGASRVQAFGPMLKELVGPGAVTESERANAMEAISKPGMNDVEVRAIIEPLMAKAQNRLKVLETERQLISQGQKLSRSQIAEQLGVDLTTGLAVGQRSSDFLPQGTVRRFNPSTGRLE